MILFIKQTNNMLIAKKHISSGCELSFQPLLLYFFTINTYIYCVINYRICIQSYTTCLELAELMVYIYGVYVDIIKFHPLGTSPLL